MQVPIGQPVELSTFIKRNGFPLTGELVSVRVVDRLNGTELLGSTIVSETSEPGLYSFSWTTAPQSKTSLAALYTFRQKIFSDFFDIVAQASFPVDLEAEIIEDVIDAEIADEPVLDAELESIELTGELDPSELTADLEPEPELEGEID